MRLFDYLLYAGVVFAWSTIWYPLSLRMGVVQAEVSLVWRLTAAAVLMFAMTAWFRVPLRYGRVEHIRFAMLGIVLFSTNFALYYNASLYAGSGLLAVILSIASLVNLLMVAVINRRPPLVLQLGAAVTGVAGVGLIFLPELQLSPTVVLALFLGGLGTLSLCIGNLISAASQKRNIHVLASTSWGMVYGTAFMVIVSLIRGHEFTIHLSVTYIGSLIWLVSISTVLAFASYLTLIGRIGLGCAGYATVIFPVIALLISTIFEGYVWAPLSFVGLALVMAGNVMMIRACD